jgi:hypothetical protein
MVNKHLEALMVALPDEDHIASFRAELHDHEWATGYVSA